MRMVVPTRLIVVDRTKNNTLASTTTQPPRVRRFLGIWIVHPLLLLLLLPLLSASLVGSWSIQRNHNNHNYNNKYHSLARHCTKSMAQEEPNQTFETSSSSPKEASSSLSLRHVLGVTTPVSTPRRTTTKGPRILGHRGALHYALENTIPSFLACVTQCHGVELDVYVIRDGSVVVFHGNDSPGLPLGSLYGQVLWDHDDHEKNDAKTRTIQDLDWSQVQALRLDPTYPEFAHLAPEEVARARIPLLQDVLVALQPYPNLTITIELKGPRTVQPVLDVVESFDQDNHNNKMTTRCTYSSFDHAQLQELRTLRPDSVRFPTGALFGSPLPKDLVAAARACGATQVHVPYHECTRHRVAALAAANLTSMAWFRGPVGMVQDLPQKYNDVGSEEGPACYQALLDTGVDQVCCNKPDLAMALLQRLEEQEQQEQALAEPETEE